MTSTAPDAGPPRRRYLLLGEYLLLFFGAVGAYAVVDPPGTPVLPLLVLAPAAWLYLRRHGGPGRGAGGTGPELRRVLVLWAAVAAFAVAAIALLEPGLLFRLPREQPVVWAVVVTVYPLLSVYPQELIFRGFLLHRYGPLFGAGRTAAAASALAFGFAHIIYGNVWSVVLTAVGGWLFARRYQRTGSLRVVVVEHGLYGVLAFTVGLDHLFYDDGTP